MIITALRRLARRAPSYTLVVSHPLDLSTLPAEQHDEVRQGFLTDVCDAAQALGHPAREELVVTVPGRIYACLIVGVRGGDEGAARLMSRIYDVSCEDTLVRIMAGEVAEPDDLLAGGLRASDHGQ